MEEALKPWHANTFGKVLDKKKELMVRLNGIQKNTQNGTHRASFTKLENRIHRDLAHINHQEEFALVLEVERKIVNRWDRNTKYYYLETTTHRKLNRILTSRDNAEVWVDDETQLTMLVNDFNKNMFTNRLANCNKYETVDTQIC